MDKIKSITIKGFKSFKSLEKFTLTNRNILIGANASGKSNFLSFFHMLNWTFKANPQFQYYVQKSGKANSLLFQGVSHTSEIEARFVFQRDNTEVEYVMNLDYGGGDRLFFAQEKYRCVERDSDYQWNYLGANNDESKLVTTKQKDLTNVLWALRRMSYYQFHNTSQTARMRQTWNVDDDNLLKEDAANLAPFLLKMKNNYPEYYEKIVSVIRLIYPEFNDFVLEPDENDIILKWQETASDCTFSAHQASDGTLRAFSLVTLLNQPEKMLPFLLIIDEPELGLHPYAIKIITGLIKSVSLKRQVLIATQSSDFVDEFEAEDIITVDKRNGETIMERQTKEKLEPWLKDYKLSDIWNANVMGGRP